MSERGSGRAASPPGSCPWDQAASHPAPAGGDPSRTAAPYSLDEIALLIEECRGWHQALDGREAGDGAFTIHCENGESEQTRLNLRATLRDVTTVLAGIVSASPDWASLDTAPQDGRWVWGEWPEIVGVTVGGSAPCVVALMRWGRPIGDSHLLPHWCREGRWTPEEPARWAPINPPPASAMEAEGRDAQQLGAKSSSPVDCNAGTPKPLPQDHHDRSGTGSEMMEER